MSDYSNFTGRLSVGIAGATRSGGKLIDEWHFVSAIESHKKHLPQPPKMVVKVSLEKSGGEMVFAARGDFVGEIRHTDINELRKQVEEILTQQHDRLVGIAWEDWLEVKIRKEDTLDSQRSRVGGLTVNYKRMKRGVNPIDGKAYTINHNNVTVPFPAPKMAGEVDPGEDVGIFKGIQKRDQDTEYSYVPATPENIAALEDIMARMETLRLCLSELLRQDVIQASLADLNEHLPALPFSTNPNQP